MKKIMFLIIIFGGLRANAQNYIINFTGTGASSTVNSVKVENLTAGTSMIINQGHRLSLTFPTNINSTEIKQSSELKIYPNPMTGNSLLQVYPPFAGNATISIFDKYGKKVAQSQIYFDNYLQEFCLSGFNSGFYLISVKGSSYQYSAKLLCNTQSHGMIKIEKVSNYQAVIEKSSKTNNKGTLSNKEIPPTDDMAYSIGDRLKFTGISGVFSTVITDIPTSDKEISFTFVDCADGDNINYPVVEIGSQKWTGENLKTTRYSNGDLIGTTEPATLYISGENAPEYQWAYDADERNVNTYGRYYTWYATTDSRNVCPIGWHVPTDAEWHTLILYLDAAALLVFDESYKAANKLKETGSNHWFGPNTGASNETGFTALPCGIRVPEGISLNRGSSTMMWSSTGYNTTNTAWIREFEINIEYVTRIHNDEKLGISVRCLKNN